MKDLALAHWSYIKEPNSVRGMQHLSVIPMMQHSTSKPCFSPPPGPAMDP